MTKKGDEIRFLLQGRIDSDNASAVEQDIMATLEGGENLPLVLDAQDLKYISSSGLRRLLRVRKKHPDVVIENVGSDVYEILDMTGFTQMMTVKKAYRTIDITGCPEIGRGANGVIYRIDRDNVVKVFSKDNALDEIMRERELARNALILGIPTAISYDVVKVGDYYGSVFELLDAIPFNRIIAEDPSKVDWCVAESVKLLKKIHSIHVPEGKLPKTMTKFMTWVRRIKEYIPEEPYERLCELVAAIPEDNRLLHNDFHTGNLMLLDDEVLLIDMETISSGNIIFEFATMYASYMGFSEFDPENAMSFLGYDHKTSARIFRRSLELYFETDDRGRLEYIEDKVRLVGYVRMLDHTLRHKGIQSSEGRRAVDFWKEKIVSGLDRVDTLKI